MSQDILQHALGILKINNIYFSKIFINIINVKLNVDSLLTEYIQNFFRIIN
jgi:hypothetical protein